MGKTKNNFFSSLALKLNFIFREHAKSSIKLVTVNHELWNTIMLISFATQIPSNIYMMYRCLKYPIYDTKSFITYTILANQFGMMVGSMLLSAQYSAVIFEGHKTMAQVQALIPGDMILLKWKYVWFYERLTGDTVAVSIGGMEALTFRFLFQLINIYIAFILFLFQSFL